MNLEEDFLLANLALKYDTDKGIRPNEHGYVRIYDELFKDLRHDNLKILEIGTGGPIVKDGKLAGPKEKIGASLKMWQDYFPNSQIYGFDIEPLFQISDTRITTGVADQSSRESLDNLLKNWGTFDIIIDDGSHYSKHIGLTFGHLFQNYLNVNGYYIIEDLNAIVAENMRYSLLAFCEGGIFGDLCGMTEEESKYIMENIAEYTLYDTRNAGRIESLSLFIGRKYAHYRF